MSGSTQTLDVFTVIEGPGLRDQNFWHQYIFNCDRAHLLWQKALYYEPTLGNRLYYHCPMYFLDVGHSFARTCSVFPAMTLQLDLPLFYDTVPVMTRLGFMTDTGSRLQITMPTNLTIDKVAFAASAHVATIGDGYPNRHFRQLIPIMDQAYAADEYSWINTMDEADRLSKRELLLKQVGKY